MNQVQELRAEAVNAGWTDRDDHPGKASKQQSELPYYGYGPRPACREGDAVTARITQQHLESYLWGAAMLLREIIDAGDYAVVRHPMYLETVLVYLATPLALRSFWALFVFLPVPALIVLRIRNEEEVLVRNSRGTRSTGGRPATGWCPGCGEGRSHGSPLRSCPGKRLSRCTGERSGESG